MAEAPPGAVPILGVGGAATGDPPEDRGLQLAAFIAADPTMILEGLVMVVGVCTPVEDAGVIACLTEPAVSLPACAIRVASLGPLVAPSQPPASPPTALAASSSWSSPPSALVADPAASEAREPPAMARPA